MPPSWLRAEDEIAPPRALPRPTTPAGRAAQREAFVRAQDAVLAKLAVPPWVRAELVAIAITETGDGRSAAAQVSNLGGAKVKQDIAAWHLRQRGFPMQWFRAAGHVASGDPREVLYCAFPSDECYWSMATARVFGTAITAPWEARYRETARRLWARDPDWIAALIAGGYRGSVTQRDPGPSIAAHHAIVAQVRLIAGANG